MPTQEFPVSPDGVSDSHNIHKHATPDQTEYSDQQKEISQLSQHELERLIASSELRSYEEYIPLPAAMTPELYKQMRYNLDLRKEQKRRDTEKNFNESKTSKLNNQPQRPTASNVDNKATAFRKKNKISKAEFYRKQWEEAGEPSDEEVEEVPFAPPQGCSDCEYYRRDASFIGTKDPPPPPSPGSMDRANRQYAKDHPVPPLPPPPFNSTDSSLTTHAQNKVQFSLDNLCLSMFIPKATITQAVFEEARVNFPIRVSISLDKMTAENTSPSKLFPSSHLEDLNSLKLILVQNFGKHVASSVHPTKSLLIDGISIAATTKEGTRVFMCSQDVEGQKMKQFDSATQYKTYIQILKIRNAEHPLQCSCQPCMDFAQRSSVCICGVCPSSDNIPEVTVFLLSFLPSIQSNHPRRGSNHALQKATLRPELVVPFAHFVFGGPNRKERLAKHCDPTAPLALIRFDAIQYMILARENSRARYQETVQENRELALQLKEERKKRKRVEQLLSQLKAKSAEQGRGKTAEKRVHPVTPEKEHKDTGDTTAARTPTAHVNKSLRTRGTGAQPHYGGFSDDQSDSEYDDTADANEDAEMEEAVPGSPDEATIRAAQLGTRHRASKK